MKKYNATIFQIMGVAFLVAGVSTTIYGNKKFGNAMLSGNTSEARKWQKISMSSGIIAGAGMGLLFGMNHEKL